MKKSDCEGVFWKTAGLCLNEYYQQQLARIRNHIKNEIISVGEESCDNEALLRAFDERESAWQAYNQKSSEFQGHCVGFCGSAHSTAGYSFLNAKAAERLSYLQNEVKNGIEIWGCPIPKARQSRILLTENYEITLEGQCELGVFLCSKAVYRGKNRSTGSTISLTGEALMALDQETETEMPIGFIFDNGNIQYQVLRSGRLSVTDRRNGTVLLEEKGLWQ